VLWALATHFQPHRDLMVIDGLPGSALDPSATAGAPPRAWAWTPRGGMGFEGVRATIAPAAMERAAALLSKLGINGAAANT
jgi:2,5-furandicarboxylate decarboxylase 1